MERDEVPGNGLSKPTSLCFSSTPYPTPVRFLQPRLLAATSNGTCREKKAGSLCTGAGGCARTCRETSVFPVPLKQLGELAWQLWEGQLPRPSPLKRKPL